MKRLLYALLACGSVLSSQASAEMHLIMVEENGCMWCARWNAEIAPIYPKTPEGQVAPLRRIEINEAIPADLTFTTPPHYTPTFILVDQGKEVSRIEGYPGDDFFWGLLNMMLVKASESTASNG